MKAKVGGELAIFVQVFAQPLLELMHFFGTLEERRIYLTNSDEDYVAEFVLEQLGHREQRRQAEAVVAADQDGGRRRVRIALGGLELFARVQFRQDVGLKLLDRLRDPLVVASHNVTQHNQGARDDDGHPATVVELQRQRDRQD